MLWKLDTMYYKLQSGATKGYEIIKHYRYLLCEVTSVISFHLIYSSHYTS